MLLGRCEKVWCGQGKQQTSATRTSEPGHLLFSRIRSDTEALLETPH